MWWLFVISSDAWWIWSEFFFVCVSMTSSKVRVISFQYVFKIQMHPVGVHNFDKVFYGNEVMELIYKLTTYIHILLHQYNLIINGNRIMVISFSHGFPHPFWLVVVFTVLPTRTRTVAHKSIDGFGHFFFIFYFQLSLLRRIRSTARAHTLDKHQFNIFGCSNWWRQQYVRPQLLPFIFVQILRPTKNNCQIYFDLDRTIDVLKLNAYSAGMQRGVCIWD